MKILKPGKARMLKMRCDNCGCEFVYEYFGNTCFTETARVKCPQDGCNGEVFLQSGTPYEEPTQDDRKRLAALIRETPDVTVWPDALDKIVKHLIANGVTFRKE